MSTSYVILLLYFLLNDTIQARLQHVCTIMRAGQHSVHYDLKITTYSPNTF